MKRYACCRLQVAIGLVLFLLSSLADASPVVTLAIADALKRPDGQVIRLKAVHVVKRVDSPPYIVVRDPETPDAIIIALKSTPDVVGMQALDVIGTLATLSNGFRALVSCELWGYANADGNLIVSPLPPDVTLEPSIDLTPLTQANGMRTMSAPPQMTPYPDDVEPQFQIESIDEIASLPDGTTVQINGKAITQTGYDSFYGPYFITSEDDASASVTTYSQVSATVNHRVSLIKGTIGSLNGQKTVSIESGPATPPTGFNPQADLPPTSSIPGAKTLPDLPASSVNLTNKTVTRVFPIQKVFYVQEPNRTAGIRIHSSDPLGALKAGDVVSLSGQVKTTSFERYIQVGEGDWSINSANNPSPRTLVMINRSVGGADMAYNSATGAGQKGVQSGNGLNTIGQFIKTTGKVTSSGASYFYINDGTGYLDGTDKGTGVRVSTQYGADGPLIAPRVGAVVAVTAISSMLHTGFDSLGKPQLANLLLVSSQNDIELVQAAPSSGGGANPYNPPPAWAEGTGPYDGFSTNGVSDSSVVDLASGAFLHIPEVDINAYNPVGPNAVFSREFYSPLSLTGDASPGLPSGWKHNYDVWIDGNPYWSDLELVYPSGSRETLRPQYNGTTPTGLFLPQGAPYVVMGEVDSQGQPGRWANVTIKHGDETRWIFKPSLADSTDLVLSQIIDSKGNYIRLNYVSGTDRLLSVTDSTGAIQLLSFSYDASNRIERVTTNQQLQVRYTYQPFGGVQSLHTVSQIGNVADPVIPTLWTYDYSIYGNKALIKGVLSPLNSLPMSVIYNAGGLSVEKLIDSNLNERRYTYRGGETDVAVYDSGSSTPDITWTQILGNNGVDSGIRDAEGNATAVAYLNGYYPWESVNKNNQFMRSRSLDAYGNFSTTTLYDTANPSKKLTASFTYDPVNPLRLTSTKIGAKPESTFEYTAEGLIWKVHTSKPGNVASAVTVTTEYEYTALGNVKKIIAPGPNDTGNNLVTEYFYETDGTYSQSEALGQPLRIVVYESAAPANILRESRFRYDTHGRVIQTIDASGNVTDYTYNKAGQLIETLEPQVSVGRVRTTWDYEFVGGPLEYVTVYNESGQVFRQVQFVNGKEGELESVKHLKVPTTEIETEVSYQYDGEYRTTIVQDGRGNKTKYQYNTVGNLWKIFLPAASGEPSVTPDTVYLYDDDDNLIQRTDANGVITDYSLDPETSRTVGINYDGAARFSYTYDVYGRLSTASDTITGGLAYTYDDLDNLLTNTVSYPGIPSHNLTYTYYPDGSRKTMVTPSGTHTYTYGHDAIGPGLKVAVQVPWVATNIIAYFNRTGQMVRQTQPRVRTTYAYDARGFLNSLRNLVDSSVYTSQFTNMVYDAAGNRTAAAISMPSIGSALDRSGMATYIYDSKDRLTSELRTLNSGGNLYSNVYTPDAADNLSPVRGLSYTFNSKNQTSAGEFDLNGNATSYSPVTGRSFGLGYDTENQPSFVTGGQNSVTMSYRADGLRAWRSLDNGPKTYFIYDGDRLVCELNSSGNVTFAYGWGANGLAQGYESSVYYACMFDPQGSLIQTAKQFDSSNASRFTDVYDAYGRLWWSQSYTGSQTFAHPVNLGYIGQWGVYTDWETRPPGDKTPLPLMGVRYYDPITGRFLSRDPIADSLNLYSYANGNPVRYIDPSGLSATGTYLGDVGQVFLGYADVLNPVNAYHGAKALYTTAKTQGVGSAGKAWWAGTVEGFSHFGSDDPRAFGQSMGNALITAAAIAAPAAKASSVGAASKTVSAANSTKTALKSLPLVAGEGAIIQGRRLTAHAAKSMVHPDRSITTRMVDATLRKGTRYWSTKHNSVTYVLQTERGRFIEVGVVDSRITHVNRVRKLASHLKPLQ